MVMNVGFTGHRNCRTTDWLFEHLNDAVRRAADKGGKWFMSGAAPGRDCDFLEAAMVERWRQAGKPNVGFDGMFDVKGLPDGVVVQAVLPFKDFWEHYREQVGQYFDNLRRQLDVVSWLDEGEYHPGKMHTRNRWIVDNNDIMIAVFDGRQKGGTYQTLKYARKQGKPILWIDPKKEVEKWIR